MQRSSKEGEARALPGCKKADHLGMGHCAGNWGEGVERGVLKE